MSATTSTSSAFPLATDQCTTDCGDGAGTANAGGTVDSEAGAGGTTDNTFALSNGAMIAIIVIVIVVALLGISTATLFYIAKKREWKVRETIRRSARKVVTALTPRRSEFPSSVKDGRAPRRSRSGRTRVEEIPPTPRLKPEDLEKGLSSSKINVKRFIPQK